MSGSVLLANALISFIAAAFKPSLLLVLNSGSCPFLIVEFLGEERCEKPSFDSSTSAKISAAS